MALVPVFCDNCGTLFATQSLIGGDIRRATFENVTVGPCPVCGKTGRVLDGTYDLIGNTVTVLSAPEWSREKLQWLERRIEAARRGAVAPDQVVDEVTSQAPELHALIGHLSRRGWKAIQILAVLLGIITFVQGQTNPPADDAAIKKATETIVQELHQRPVTPTYSTTPRNQPRPPKRKPKPGKTHGRDKTPKKK
jgi:hypothetical protein